MKLSLSYRFTLLVRSVIAVVKKVRYGTWFGRKVSFFLRSLRIWFTLQYAVVWYAERLFIVVPLAYFSVFCILYFVPSLLDVDYSLYKAPSVENVKKMVELIPLSTLSSLLTSGGAVESVSVRRGSQERLTVCLHRGMDPQARVVRQFFLNLRFGATDRALSLVDLYAVDRLGMAGVAELNRFSVNYLFWLKSGSLLTVEIPICSKRALPTVSDLWLNAEWAEREVFDTFGVRFLNHPDLRRLLTDYGFRGFPFRKEFPSFGFKQVRYSEINDSVNYEKFSLEQVEREVNFVNPWHRSWGVITRCPPFLYELEGLWSVFKVFLKKIS